MRVPMPRSLATWWIAFLMPPPPHCRGACLGDWSRRRHLPAAGLFLTADSRMPSRPSRAWYGRPCAALTSSTTSPHWKTRLRHPRGSLPGPSHPPQPSPLHGGAGLSDASPRRGSRRLRGIFPWPSLGVLPPLDRLPPPDCHLPSHLRCSPRPFSGWGQTSELSWGQFFFYLNLLVRRCFLTKSDLPDGYFTSTNLKGGGNYWEHISSPAALPGRPIVWYYSNQIGSSYPK